MLDKNATIIVTGAYGFIGSCLVSHLNKEGYENLILVDEFDDEEKELNLHEKKYFARIERENFFEWIVKENMKVDFVFHLGARTDTTEFDYSVHQKLNLEYSQQMWNYCTSKNIPLVYASSAATYGNGELGYSDEDDALSYKLEPLNPYGVSKNEFDKWALEQNIAPAFWAGLKFFNVYGPNEYHKARMASVIFHSFNQIKQNGKVKLFRSHKEGFKDGEQLRDFVYVKDVVSVCYWLMQETVNRGQLTDDSTVYSGLYNLGTGKARSFDDLVKSTFAGLDLQAQIEYIDMPEDIRDKYQYFTEASMDKLKRAGYTTEFYSLEKGVDDYVRNYLSEKNFY
ncbi:MAG: ADP-glyceromanno-heptose 6-epimerase [Ferruginibacter sp.]